jgi:hypothetical protein
VMMVVRPNESVEKSDLQSGFSCFVLMSQSVIKFHFRWRA